MKIKERKKRQRRCSDKIKERKKGTDREQNICQGKANRGGSMRNMK